MVKRTLEEVSRQVCEATCPGSAQEGGAAENQDATGERKWMLEMREEEEMQQMQLVIVGFLISRCCEVTDSLARHQDRLVTAIDDSHVAYTCRSPRRHVTGNFEGQWHSSGGEEALVQGLRDREMLLGAAKKTQIKA